MAFLDNNGVGTLWGRIKTVFGAGFAAIVKDSSSVTIKLQNGYEHDLDTVVIPLVDKGNSTAGLMSPTDKGTLDSLNSAMPSYSSSNNKKVVWGDGAIEALNFKPNAGTDNVPVQLYKGSTTGTPLYTAFSVPSASTTTAGVMTSADKVKLNGIASGAEVNVQADWNETDTTSDAYIANKPTIPTLPSNIVNKITTTAGAHTTIANATGNVSFNVPTEASHVGAVPTSRKINGQALSSDVTLNGSQIPLKSTGNLTIAVAMDNKVDKETGKGLSTNDYTATDKTKVGYVDTGKSVSTYVSEQISTAMTGSAKYKGTVGTGGTVTTLPTSGYKQGDYYVVCTAGTYAGETCEVGDMIFANKDYASGAVAADDWDIVQSNITAMTTEEINAICV